MNITTFDFQDKIEDGISLVKFQASWCGPCKRYAPTFDAFAEENPNIKCFSVDAEAEQDLCTEFNVSSIPVTLLFKDGELKQTKNGILTKDQLSELIKSCE
jgi:thioredoxin 1